MEYEEKQRRTTENMNSRQFCQLSIWGKWLDMFASSGIWSLKDLKYEIIYHMMPSLKNHQ